MIICNRCGSSGVDGLRSCPECGAENPLVSGPELPTLHLSAEPSHSGTTAVLNVNEIKTTPLNSQSALPHVSEAVGSQFIQPGAIAPGVLADTQARSSHTALVVAVTVAATVCVLAIGFIGVRAWLKDDNGENKWNTESTTFPAATPTPTIRPAGSPPVTVNKTADVSAIEREVTATLNGWVAAIRAHDLDTYISYYTDMLETYYQRSNVSASFVRSDKARAFHRYNKLDVQLNGIEVTLDASGISAAAVFDKTYNFEGDKYLSGSVRQAIWLRKIDGRWLITGEKDLQVYYVNH